MTEIASSEAEVKVTSVVETGAAAAAVAAVVAPTLIGLGVIVKTAVEAFSEAASIVRPVEAAVMVSLRLLDFKQLVEETGTGGTLDLGGRGGGIFCCCCGCCGC